MPPPASVGFAFSVLGALRAGEPSALEPVMSPRARAQIAALLADPDGPVMAAIRAGATGVNVRRAGDRALARFATPAPGQAAVIVMSVDATTRWFVLDAIEVIAAAEFDQFGVVDDSGATVTG